MNDIPTIRLATPMALLGQAIEQGSGIEVITQLMELTKEYKKDLAREAFNAAISDAKNKIPIIDKNRSVDFTSSKGRTNYKYEDLAEIARTIDPILGEFGLSYRFRTNVQNGTVVVTCIVSHRDGHFEENSLPADIDTSGNKNHLQAVGSAVTYLSRYTLKAALGLAASNDDDGQAAGAPLNQLILDAQADRLRDLIEETGSDAAKLCAFFKIDNIADLTQAEFTKAVKMLEAKRSRA
jgi:ERF superfamily